MENTIKIHLRQKEDYKNTYNEEILSYELSNYILEELNGINTKQNIKFIISSDFYMSEEEKNNLVDMIRNNFGANISEIIHFRKKKNITNCLIFLVGIVFLIAYSHLGTNILSEFALIFGWVLLGEAICNFLYTGIDNEHKISRRKQIVKAKISFE